MHHVVLPPGSPGQELVESGDFQKAQHWLTSAAYHYSSAGRCHPLESLEDDRECGRVHEGDPRDVEHHVLRRLGSSMSRSTKSGTSRGVNVTAEHYDGLVSVDERDDLEVIVVHGFVLPGPIESAGRRAAGTVRCPAAGIRLLLSRLTGDRDGLQCVAAVDWAARQPGRQY